LQVLNAIDGVVILGAIGFSLFNLFKFVVKGEIRHFFIIVFYLLAMFCLASWEVTAIAQTINPEIRYLVFQLRDGPKYFHVTADLS